MFTGKHIYTLLADLLVLAHFIFVSFVVFGFITIWVGHFLRWSFIRNFYFRVSHLIAMGIVTLQAVGGVICPLTVWEDQLRIMGGQAGRYESTFIQHWIHKVLYYDISLEVFSVIYVLFFLAIIATFILIKPHLPKL